MGERLGRFIGQYRQKYFIPDKRSAIQVFTWKPRPGAEEAIFRRIADTLEEYLKNPGKLAAIREAGRAFAEKTDWDTETAKICRYVLDGIREAEDQASSSLIS